MREDYAKEECSICLVISRAYRRICHLSWGDKWRIGYFCMSFAMLVGRVENEHYWILIALAINLIVSYEQVRKHSIIEKIKLDNYIKEDEDMNEMDKDSLRGLFEGANLDGAQIVIAQSGSKVVYKEVAPTKEEKTQVTDEQIADAIQKNKTMFWAQSAWAVFFCVCRDYLGMTQSMTEMEHYIKGLPFTQALPYECPDGTIQKTLANNPFMKLPINKWKTNGGKERAILLAEKLIAELDEKINTF